MNSTHTEDGLNSLLAKENVHVQLSVPQLVEKVLSRNEATLTSTGAIRVSTGKYTAGLRKINLLLKNRQQKIKLAGKQTKGSHKRTFLNYMIKFLPI